MPFGFYIIMAAQFFSALADNALFISALGVLSTIDAPQEMQSLLKFVFSVSYVLLAAFVGPFADSMPKGRVMLISNSIKIFGCLLFFFNVHPLIAYAVVGLGAAAYSPAKYGILTEYLPHRLLVVANSWVEGLTVGAIILGTVLGGFLIDPDLTKKILTFSLPAFNVSLTDIGIDSVIKMNVILISACYLIAAIFNLYVPNTGVDHKPLSKNMFFLLREFGHCVKLLWRDKLGQISMAVTTLFWGIGGVLQVLIIQWAEVALGLEEHDAAKLQGVVAIGIAVGAIMAAKMISLRKSVKVLPLGVVMGGFMVLLAFVNNMYQAVPLLIIVGALSGFFVVPMNALLQHRGHILMGAGHSIAVQSFNENLSILVLVSIYTVLRAIDISPLTAFVMFGVLVGIVMILIRAHHLANQRQRDDVALLEDKIH